LIFCRLLDPHPRNAGTRGTATPYLAIFFLSLYPIYTIPYTLLLIYIYTVPYVPIYISIYRMREIAGKEGVENGLPTGVPGVFWVPLGAKIRRRRGRRLGQS
jgi:hypothetical protein